MCFKLTSRGDSAWLFIGRGEDLLFLAHTAIKTFASESWSVIHVDPFRVLNPRCPAPLFFHLETLLETCLCLMVLQTRNVFQLVRVHYPGIMHVCVSKCWTTLVGILSLPCPWHPAHLVWSKSRYLCSELHSAVGTEGSIPSSIPSFLLTMLSFFSLFKMWIIWKCALLILSAMSNTV